MKSIEWLDPRHLSEVKIILTDMDETLTHQGRLAAVTYNALERLQDAGIAVIVNTAAPAGWCDQMARMWPIAGVIGENGGFFFKRETGENLHREFWHDQPAAVMTELLKLYDRVRQDYPHIEYAADQPFRLTSLALKRSGEEDRHIVDLLRELGAGATINNLWVLGWLGDYDKLAMARRVLAKHYNIDIDHARDRIAYLGDSENDAPMFAHFHHSFGMSTVGPGLSAYPTWQTAGPGGAGFVEVALKILGTRV